MKLTVRQVVRIPDVPGVLVSVDPPRRELGCCVVSEPPDYKGKEKRRKRFVNPVGETKKNREQPTPMLAENAVL